jgi:hypothetical protein
MKKDLTHSFIESVLKQKDLTRSVIESLLKQNELLRHERDDLTQEIQAIRIIIQQAYQAYNEPGKRQDERARDVLKILCFTSEKKQPTINKRFLFWDYLGLITGSPDINDMNTWKNTPKALSKQAAIELLAKKYVSTFNAVHKHLRDFQTEQKRACEAAGIQWHGWHNLLPPHK